MKCLYFNPANSTGIFHHQVTKAFRKVKGFITIHDNILIYRQDVEKHNKSILALIQRAADRGIMFKLDKSKFCAAEVK